MGAYTYTSIVEKMITYKMVIEHAAKAEGLQSLSSIPKINTLTAIKLLNRKKKPATNMGVCWLLRANKHSIRYKDFDRFIAEFVEVGLVRKGGGKGLNYYVTEAGKAALDDLDTMLKRAIVKTTVKDKLLRNLPGPKKGNPMPNRWPAGQPKGRIPKILGGK